MNRTLRFFSFATIFFATVFSALGQTYDSALFDGLSYREIGPFRGGRSAAVTGVPGKPNLFYFGATGGGV